MVPLDRNRRILRFVGEATEGRITAIHHPSVGEGQHQDGTGKTEQHCPVHAPVGVDERPERLKGVVPHHRIGSEGEPDQCGNL